MTTKERIFILNKAELNFLRMTKENSKFMDIGDHSHGLDSLLKDDQKIKTVINLPASSFRTSAHQSPAKLDVRKKHTFLRKKHSKTTPIPLLNSPLTPKAQNIKQPSPTSRAQSAAETIKLSRESTPLSAEKEKPKTESQPIIGAPRPRQQKRLDKLEPKPLHNNITKTPSRSFIIKHKKGDSFESQKIIVNTNVPNDNMHDKIEIVGSKIGINELTPPPKKMCNYSPKPISEERKSDNSSLASYKNLSKDDSNNSKIEETILSQSKAEVSNIEQDSSGEGNYPKRKTRPRKELTNVVLKKDDMINSEVRIGGMIGEGAYGRVFEAFNLDTGNFIAVKVIDLEEDQQKPSINIQNLCAEIEVYQKLDHENIVRYLGAKQEKDTAYIYMEYMPGGSIYSMLKQYGPFEEQVIQKFTRQVALGLDYLHSMGVIHRDIKGANILSDGNGNVKLADFGAAKHIDYLPFIASTSSSDLCSSIKGSLYWMAPELLDQKKHGRKIDIWSLGCTVIEMATASHPWSDVKNFTDLVMALMMRKCPPIPDNLSDCAKDFIKQCCQFDPKLRPKIRTLLEHPFIKSSNTS